MTQKATHTPGNWLVRTNSLREDNRRYITVVRDIPSRPRICEVDEWEGAEEGNDLANARLIAAAPDLLKALDGIQCFMERNESRLCQEELSHYQVINAALVKARGE